MFTDTDAYLTKYLYFSVQVPSAITISGNTVFHKITSFTKQALATSYGYEIQSPHADGTGAGVACESVPREN